jgi:hypothetical protein
MNYSHLTRPIRPVNRPLFISALLMLSIAACVLLIVGPKKFLNSATNLIETPAVQRTTQTVSNGADPNSVATEHRASEISQRLHRHWENSLLAVEKVNVNAVTILEFRPDYSNGALVLRGEAKEFAGLADYIAQLNATGLISQVALMHEQAVSREHVDTIEFELKGNL